MSKPSGNHRARSKEEGEAGGAATKSGGRHSPGGGARDHRHPSSHKAKKLSASKRAISLGLECSVPLQEEDEDDDLDVSGNKKSRLIRGLVKRKAWQNFGTGGGKSS